MKVTINGNEQNVAEGMTLRALLEKLGKLEQRGIAVAVNASVVTSAEWKNLRLFEGDSVLIIQATQGG